MAIQKLDFAQPFFEVEYVEQEAEYVCESKSLIFNLAERSGKALYIKGIPVMPLKGTVAEKVTVEQITRMLVVKNYDSFRLDNPDIIRQIKQTWRSLYECSGIERHKGIPYFKSPKARIGGDTEINFCFVSEPMAPSGPHRDHDREFDEVHAQIRGFGKMQKFVENDTATFYQESIMAPGVVHEKFYNEDGVYPWHQYHSLTPCIYMPIEIDRPAK